MNDRREIFNAIIEIDKNGFVGRCHITLWKFFKNVEEMESLFDIEFSCGDGLFLSDIENNPELFAKYDDAVDYQFPPRFNDSGKLLIGKFKFICYELDDNEWMGKIECLNPVYMDNKNTPTNKTLWDEYALAILGNAQNFGLGVCDYRESSKRLKRVVDQIMEIRDKD